MTHDPQNPFPQSTWLKEHGDLRITPSAIEAGIAFSKGELGKDAVKTLVGISLHNFLVTYEPCPFFDKYARHWFVALAHQFDPQLDHETAFILHAVRTAKGYVVGTPEQYPVAEGYEQERVIEEAQLVSRMADEA